MPIEFRFGLRPAAWSALGRIWATFRGSWTLAQPGTVVSFRVSSPDGDAAHRKRTHSGLIRLSPRRVHGHLRRAQHPQRAGGDAHRALPEHHRQEEQGPPFGMAGVEVNLLYIAALAALILGGAGAASFDGQVRRALAGGASAGHLQQ
jgi:hypothetical protein